MFKCYGALSRGHSIGQHRCWSSSVQGWQSSVHGESWPAAPARAHAAVFVEVVIYLFIYFCRIVVLFCSPFRLRSLLLYLACTVKLSGDCEHAQMLWAKLRRAVHPSWGGMAGGSAGGPDDTSRFALLGDRVPTKQLGKLGVKGQEAGRCSRVGKEKKRTD